MPELKNTFPAPVHPDLAVKLVRKYGTPEIFNTDQGVQYTSEAFPSVLKSHVICISMDDRGRALDNIFVERLWRNVKQEELYLKGYETAVELMRGLTEYFRFYNTRRPHQSLGHKTPAKVYESATGGGARIVDKFSQKSASEGSSETTGSQQKAA